MKIQYPDERVEKVSLLGKKKSSYIDDAKQKTFLLCSAKRG